ncbi:MAG: hypothetical protein Greene101449_96 [Candidatus Peregrinibacteria bacterium Greene1014_49]|nr:MAG: hypothetical protein Greene101449_96 [Candidatus Peregrinibacteria bacterium Greene1014_49]
MKGFTSINPIHYLEPLEGDGHTTVAIFAMDVINGNLEQRSIFSNKRYQAQIEFPFPFQHVHVISGLWGKYKYRKPHFVRPRRYGAAACVSIEDRGLTQAKPHKDMLKVNPSDASVGVEKKCFYDQTM